MESHSEGPKIGHNVIAVHIYIITALKKVKNDYIFLQY